MSCIDIIVVKQADGSFKSSPFFIRFNRANHGKQIQLVHVYLGGDHYSDGSGGGSGKSHILRGEVPHVQNDPNALLKNAISILSSSISTTNVVVDGCSLGESTANITNYSGENGEKNNRSCSCCTQWKDNNFDMNTCEKMQRHKESEIRRESDGSSSESIDDDGSGGGPPPICCTPISTRLSLSGTGRSNSNTIHTGTVNEEEQIREQQQQQGTEDDQLFSQLIAQSELKRKQGLLVMESNQRYARFMTMQKFEELRSMNLGSEPPSHSSTMSSASTMSSSTRAPSYSFFRRGSTSNSSSPSHSPSHSPSSSTVGSPETSGSHLHHHQQYAIGSSFLSSSPSSASALSSSSLQKRFSWRLSRRSSSKQSFSSSTSPTSSSPISSPTTATVATPTATSCQTPSYDRTPVSSPVVNRSHVSFCSTTAAASASMDASSPNSPQMTTTTMNNRKPSTPPTPTSWSDRWLDSIERETYEYAVVTPDDHFIRQMNLKDEVTPITFEFNGERIHGRVFLWNHDTRIVVSDIDGTITKSDIGGHIFTRMGMDYAQPGVASVLTNFEKRGYKIMYLTARSISMFSSTRSYIESVKQGEIKLPLGPVITAPNKTSSSLVREVIIKRPESFKINILECIKSLFQSEQPFVAAWGNRPTDDFSYATIGIDKQHIYRVNKKGHVEIKSTNVFFQSHADFEQELNRNADWFPIVAHSNDGQQQPQQIEPEKLDEQQQQQQQRVERSLSDSTTSIRCATQVGDEAVSIKDECPHIIEQSL